MSTLIGSYAIEICVPTCRKSLTNVSYIETCRFRYMIRVFAYIFFEKYHVVILGSLYYSYLIYSYQLAFYAKFVLLYNRRGWQTDKDASVVPYVPHQGSSAGKFLVRLTFFMYFFSNVALYTGFV